MKKLEKILTITAITLDTICIVMNISSFNAYVINKQLLESTIAIEQSMNVVELKIEEIELTKL